MTEYMIVCAQIPHVVKTSLLIWHHKLGANRPSDVDI